MPGVPGDRGGISRGPGVAVLTGKGETAELRQKLRRERLRPVKKGRDPGVKLSDSEKAPEVNTENTARRAEARSFEDTRQGITHKHRIAPRHRGAVRRYFGRENEVDDEK